MREAKGPQLLHVFTTKGKGFAPAEADPIGYHAITKIAPVSQRVAQVVTAPTAAPKKKYSDVFGDWLCDAAARDLRLIAITPAMCEGSGMVRFAAEYPDRYHDVAIAEQHAVTFAAGLACEGLKPVVAIYSTFLQRGYDQLIHDVTLQNLDVTFGIDRAGLVGEDGPTHAGAYDLSFMRCLPNLIIAAPSDENECRQLLETCWQHPGPAAVRYPRGTGPGSVIDREPAPLAIGRGVIRRPGERVAILNFGARLQDAMQAAEQLSAQGDVNATVVDMRWVKPLDAELIRELATAHELFVTLEEHAVAGGAGSAVAEFLHQDGLRNAMLMLGIRDAYIEHGSPTEMLADCGLDAAGIAASIRQRLR